MTLNDFREYVTQVFAYLKSDYSDYEKARQAGWQIGAGPYLLTASSGIDFFGSLAVPDIELKKHERSGLGLARKSTTGSRWFIRNYLSSENGVYGGQFVPDLIYKALRCGQVHEGIVKKGVLIGTLAQDKYHMAILRLKETESNDPPLEVVYVNTRILCRDFLAATQGFIQEVTKRDDLAAQMSRRLEEHLNSEPKKIQSLALQTVDVSEKEFMEIYDGSSSRAHHPTTYRLKSEFWRRA